MLVGVGELYERSVRVVLELSVIGILIIIDWNVPVEVGGGPCYVPLFGDRESDAEVVEVVDVSAYQNIRKQSLNLIIRKLDFLANGFTKMIINYIHWDSPYQAI